MNGDDIGRLVYLVVLAAAGAFGVPSYSIDGELFWGDDSFEDMAPPEEDFYDFLVSQVGAGEADRLFADFGAGYTSSSYTVWMHQPDLSFDGAGSGADD